MTMPSNSGTTKDSAHDRAKTQASAARTPSASPRASTAVRVAGSVTSDSSAAKPGCSTTRAESAVTMGTGTAAEVVAYGHGGRAHGTRGGCAHSVCAEQHLTIVSA